ncbi:MAG: Holliday junction branch migration protein RuvA [Gammaproteobacteria bacterium TMED180]|nr:MAG: Holliday junction branch migration protein RuvA [Gammaproteobacteria bacterium TMED180]
MIARLTGRVLTLDQGALVLDVNGVGYEIEVASSTANSVEIDKIVTLETLLIVREDAQILFGFTELTDKKLFQLLIKINGVGPRLAIGIMSGLNEEELSLAIMEKDIKILTSLPGVGKKTAERLVIELQDKISFEKASGKKNKSKMSQELLSDLEGTLLNLGYKPQEVDFAIHRIKIESTDLEVLIKAALKELGRR